MSSIVGRGNHFRLKDPFKVNLDVWVDNDNEYTPAQILDMWLKCIWEINDCPIIDEWTLEFGSKEMLLNFLVFLGVDV